MTQIELEALQVQIIKDKTIIRVLEKVEKVLDKEIIYNKQLLNVDKLVEDKAKEKLVVDENLLRKWGMI